MIGKLSGLIDHRGDDHVLIDVRGVGYVVQVSERTLAALPAVGEAASLFTELVVREDLLQLIGFPSLLEKEWYRLLTTVQGIGTKAALAILGRIGPDGLGRAIALGDVRAIQSAPGVGPKLAQRVVLELKSKAPAVMAQGGTLGAVATAGDVIEPPIQPRRARAAPVPAPAAASYTADALSALVNLGYGPGDAAQAVAAASGERPDADTATLIRLSLKLLAPR